MKEKTCSSLSVDAVTFDDFYTLRYPVEEAQKDVIYPIFKALRKNLKVGEKEFLREYSKIDKGYRRRVKETLREARLDDLVTRALANLGQKQGVIKEIVKRAVAEGLAARKTRWYSDARDTLRRLKKKGYGLGLISNTHWPLPANRRNELEKYFDVITLSYEHGYVKPHPSIFLVTLEKLKVDANRCLHVGDDPTADVQGAKHVGMKTAFVRRRNEKADADVQINRISELLQLL